MSVNHRDAGLRFHERSAQFPATGMNSLSSFRIISGSENVDARSHCPLFHVQPNGCPFIIQKKRGLPFSCASRRARWRFARQGICIQSSSPAEGSTDSIFLSSSASGANSKAMPTAAASIRFGARERTRTFTPFGHMHLKHACLPFHHPRGKGNYTFASVCVPLEERRRIRPC